MKLLVIAAVIVAVLGRPQEDDGLEGLAPAETDLDDGKWKDDVSNNPEVMGTNPETQGTANADESQDQQREDQHGEERRKRGIDDNEVFSDDPNEDIGLLMETITVQDLFLSGNVMSTDMTRSPATPSLDIELELTTTTTTTQPPPTPPAPLSGFCRMLKRTYEYFCAAP